MIKINDKKDCCGCEACVQICPKGCIHFDSDEEGFGYPNVDTSACIGCGLCEKVCPVINKGEIRTPLTCYGGWNEDATVRLASSSGGVFSALAENIINEGGIVYGAEFAADWSVQHIGIESKKGLPRLRGSKYVQSRIGKTYTEAEKHLKAGRKVLFSGTGCQISGLKRYLRKPYDNLLTIEVVCHGVPSPKVWQEYLRMRSDANPKHVTFRDKAEGWYRYRICIGDYSAIGGKDEYMHLFIETYSERPSCGQCPVRQGRSDADITLGDYWGVDKIDPELFDNNKGTSLLVIWSENGNRAIDSLKNICLHEAKYEQAILYNPSMITDNPENPNRDEFWREYRKNPIQAILKYGHVKSPSIAKRLLTKIIRTIWSNISI